MDFTTFGLDPRLLRGIADLGFTAPTPIQAQALPAGLEGRDLLAAAMTGSGKTAAFLLPILQRLLAKPRGTTRALILTPTRELAAQILEHFQGLAKHTPLKAAAVFGGVAHGPQERAFRDGVDLLVATPGRLLDHLQQSYAKLDRLDVLVLDEADRMLDMGFLPDVRRVLAKLNRDRQTFFFSATLPPEIQKLSKEMLRDPVALNVERKAAPATGITQRVYPVAAELKSALLLELLRRGELGSVIVFTRTKHRTNRLSDFLEKHGVPNARIHGNRSQNQRTEALAGFKDGRLRVLVATDIVARGIDVEQLEHVVNFDVPHMPEDYIHRVGRTARAEATGEAYTFVAPDEEGDLKQIERAVGKPIPRVTLDGFDYRARAEALEVPLADRIAEIRARKKEERARAAEKAARRVDGGGSRSGSPAPRSGSPAPRSGSPAPRSGSPAPRSGSPAQPPRFDPRGPHSAGRRDRDERPPRMWSSGPSEAPPPRPRDPRASEVRPGVWRTDEDTPSGGRR